ncbi:hypothetical protein A2U01_0000914 [Trifolium medium]|uniref:Uncharacterized protein n=1 Tax=Trifolium medium TaxID=97028 RepID=A0A392LYT0_9FABA|nr:hypothetical protein [Trifolium medium]
MLNGEPVGISFKRPHSPSAVTHIAHTGVVLSYEPPEKMSGPAVPPMDCGNLASEHPPPACLHLHLHGPPIASLHHYPPPHLAYRPAMVQDPKAHHPQSQAQVSAADDAEA